MKLPPSKHHFIGSVIYAWMPHSEAPHLPGPKFRPVLVVGVDEKAAALCIAPGTSQKIDLVYRGQIRVDQVVGGRGLLQPTKFKVDEARWVPCSPGFLQGHGHQYRFAGEIPVNLIRELYEVIREVEHDLSNRCVVSLAS